MAFVDTTTLISGATVDAAYHRVDSVSIRGKTLLCIALAIYSADRKTPLENRDYEAAYDLTGDNPLAQAYAHLRSLPEYAAATDV